MPTYHAVDCERLVTASWSRRQGFVDGFTQKFVERCRVLDLRDMAHALDHDELGTRDELCEPLALRKRGDAVERTPDDVDRHLEASVRGGLLAGCAGRRT